MASPGKTVKQNTLKEKKKRSIGIKTKHDFKP